MKPQIDEHDEFLLSLLVDGDLPADEAALLRERMAGDAELQAAFEALVRVDQALAGRREDQPDIDWGQFRRDVVDAVKREALKPAIIRIPRWAWIATPLAAAAAIALVFTSLMDRGRSHVMPGQLPVAKVAPPAVENQSIKIAQMPRVVENGSLVVRFHRPSVEQKSTGTVRVSYTQSADLAKAMQQRDTERRSRPTGHLYLAETKQRMAPQVDMADLPPLL